MIEVCIECKEEVSNVDTVMTWITPVQVVVCWIYSVVIITLYIIVLCCTFNLLEFCALYMYVWYTNSLYIDLFHSKISHFILLVLLWITEVAHSKYTHCTWHIVAYRKTADTMGVKCIYMYVNIYIYLYWEAVAC